MAYNSKHKGSTIDNAIDKIIANYSKDQIDVLLDKKQPLLKSGSNIKTINNESIVGYGNIDINGSLSPEEKAELYRLINARIATINGNGPDLSGNIEIETLTAMDRVLINKALDAVDDIKEALEDLPSGEAVSAQVALNTAAIQDINNNFPFSILNGKVCITYNEE